MPHLSLLPVSLSDRLMLEPLFGTFLDPKPLQRSPQLTSTILARALGVTEKLASTWLLPMQYAAMHASLDTTNRLAAFLAQIGHETGSLRWLSEIWGPTAAQSRYQTHPKLGNTQPGDGLRYRGRGLIQVTGRANYRATTEALRFLDCPDFEAHPDALLDPRWAALSAASYWNEHSLNELADADDINGITRAINGGTNGLLDRIERYARAKDAIA